MNSELFCCDWYKKDCNTIKPSSYKYPYRLLFISVDGSILLWMRSKLLANTEGVFFNFTRWLLFNFHCFLYKSYFILINGTFSLKKKGKRLHKRFNLISYFDWEKIKDLQNAFRYFLQECLYAKLQNK